MPNGKQNAVAREGMEGIDDLLMGTAPPTRCQEVAWVSVWKRRFLGLGATNHETIRRRNRDKTGKK